MDRRRPEATSRYCLEAIGSEIPASSYNPFTRLSASHRRYFHLALTLFSEARQLTTHRGKGNFDSPRTIQAVIPIRPREIHRAVRAASCRAADESFRCAGWTPTRSSLLTSRAERTEPSHEANTRAARVFTRMNGLRCSRDITGNETMKSPSPTAMPATRFSRRSGQCRFCDQKTMPSKIDPAVRSGTASSQPIAVNGPQMRAVRPAASVALQRTPVNRRAVKIMSVCAKATRA